MRKQGSLLVVLAVASVCLLGACSSGENASDSTTKLQSNPTTTVSSEAAGETDVAVDCTARGPGVDLHGCDLTDADLNGVNLYGAKLTGANLTRANLTRASLTGANLTDANLFGANLYQADLNGAELFGANLTDANLFGANLTGADLTDALWQDTTCPNGVVQSTECST